MKIFVVQGLHPIIPGCPISAFATREGAVREVVRLLKRMPGKPDATPANWQSVLRTLQKNFPDRNCDVWIAELELEE